MNKLRLTNVTENHFYLDFNWKDGGAVLSVSQRVSLLKTQSSRRDTDETDEWSVSWQRKNLLKSFCSGWDRKSERIKRYRKKRNPLS